MKTIRPRVTARLVRQFNNECRRAAAAKQKPLPLAEQQRRAAERREAHQARYPRPPKLDPLAHVRGDPRGKDQPAPPLPRGRRLTLADLVYAFDVTGELRARYAKHKGAGSKLAA